MSFFNRKEKSGTRKSISVGYVVLSCIVLAYFCFEAGKVSWGIGIIAFLILYGAVKALPLLSEIKKKDYEKPVIMDIPEDTEDYDHTDETEEIYRDMYGYDDE